MASWSELLKTLQEKGSSDPAWLDKQLSLQLSNISELRNQSTVIFYASAFLQKKQGIGALLEHEDVNGFMNALYGVENGRDLTLILHTPGGDPNAVESIVDYLHAKFERMEVIVPYLAMSGGAMISLASDLLILGKPSQLGPIDPQLNINNKIHSARAIQEGFEEAKSDILSDVKLAHLWAPILQSMGPSLMVEAEKALSYSKELVVGWLNQRMFHDISDESERKDKVDTIAAYFNAEDTAGHGRIHVHGQRIGMEKLRQLGVKVELLEDNQNLQNAVLTAYRLMTLIFETSSSVKFIACDKGRMWAKQQVQQPIFVSQPLQPDPQQAPPNTP